MNVVNPLYVKNKEEQSKTVPLDMSSGDQVITPDANKTLSQVTVQKPASLVSSNIKSGATIGGVPGSSTVVDVSDSTVTATDVLYGEDFYLPDGSKTSGSIPTYSGPTTIIQNGTIATSGMYLSSDIEVSVPSQTPVLITKNIVANGVYNASSDNADGYSSVNVNVQSAGSSDVTFFDYDGTIVDSYSSSDFANLSSMPANPTHAGLVADGWNWSLLDAKQHVATYGRLNIGQMYHTASGKTEYDIHVDESTGFTATLTNTSGLDKDWGDGTVDTNTTHTYSSAGNYTIQLTSTWLPNISASKKLIAVRIASGTTNILFPSFQNCRLLKYVTMPSDTINIDISTFYYCFSLGYVTIPQNVTNIGNNAFNACYSLKNISIPNAVTDLGNQAFQSCYNLQSLDVPNGVTNFGTSIFYQCNNLKYINIPSGLTTLGASAFNGCSSLPNVNIPSTITSFGANSVFSNCYSLKQANIPSNSTSVNTYTFQNCYSLENVTIPDTVTTISNGAFDGCYSILSITIPASVTSIATNAFRGCQWMSIVTLKCTVPPSVTSTSFTSNVTTFYVPNGSLSAYQADTNWNTNYGSRLVELPA